MAPLPRSPGSRLGRPAARLMYPDWSARASGPGMPPPSSGSAAQRCSPVTRCSWPPASSLETRSAGAPTSFVCVVRCLPAAGSSSRSRPVSRASPPGEQLVEAVAEALRGDPKLSVVVATLNPTGQPSLDSVLRVPGLVAERVHRLPAWVGLDDVAAAMSGSIAVLATTPAFAHLAASLGVARHRCRPRDRRSIRPGNPRAHGSRPRDASDAHRRRPSRGDRHGHRDPRRRLRRACPAPPPHRVARNDSV